MATKKTRCEGYALKFTVLSCFKPPESKSRKTQFQIDMEKAKAESLKFLSDAQISDTDYYVSDDDGFRPPVVRPTQKYVLVKSDVKGSALMWLGCL